MNMNQIKEVARDRGVKAGKMKKTELVRAIQEAEGNTPCFASGQVDSCGQQQCLWREDCC